MNAIPTTNDHDTHEVEQYDTPVYSLFTCSTSRPGMKPIPINLLVDNKDFVMEVDTGASFASVGGLTSNSVHKGIKW